MKRRDFIWGSCAVSLPIKLTANTVKYSQVHTPAGIRDFKSNPLMQTDFDQRWSQNIYQWVSQSKSICKYDNFKINSNKSGITKLIEWTAFPNRINTFFGPSGQDYPGKKYSHEELEQQLFKIADSGLINGKALPEIPSAYCPNETGLLPGLKNGKMPYLPIGARGWQDEYCEWSVSRNDDSTLNRITFVCETVEYWHALWRFSPNKVLSLYQDLVNTDVKLSDLYLMDSNDRVVMDPVTDLPSYNPMNKWNLGSDSGNIVHFCCTPSSLPSEIGLAVLASDAIGLPEKNAHQLNCKLRLGLAYRHSDPHIAMTVSQLAQNFDVTLENPVGLYMQYPDFSSFQVPSDIKKAGYSMKDFYHIERGHRGVDPYLGDSILRASISIPQEIKDRFPEFKLEQIRIDGEKFRYGSQLAKHFKVGLRAIAFKRSRSKPKPRKKTPFSINIMPLALMGEDQLASLLHTNSFDGIAKDKPQLNNITGLASLAAPLLYPGKIYKKMCLIVHLAPTVSISDLSFSISERGFTISDITKKPIENFRTPLISSAINAWAISFNLQLSEKCSHGHKNINIKVKSEVKSVFTNSLFVAEKG